MSSPRCRLCWAELTHTFVDLGMSPPCESYLSRRPARPGGDVLPAARAGLLGVPARAAACLHPGRGHLHRLRLLLVVLATPGCGTPSGSSTWPLPRLGLDGESFIVEVASNDGYLLQHSVARGIRSLGDRAGCERRRGRRRQGHRRPRSCSSERRRAPRSPPRHGRADLVVAQQRLRARAGHRRLRPRACARWSRTTATSRIEIPHLLRLIDGNAVRHDLPRALLLPLAADDPAGARRGRTDRRRRRGAADARRVAADLVDADRVRRCPSARRSRPGARRRGARPGCTRWRATHGFAAAVAKVTQRPPGVPHRRSRARGDRGRLRRARARATRCSTTAASARTCSRSRVDRSPFKHGQVPARHAHPDPSPSRRWPRQAGLRPDPAWNLREEISRPARVRPRVGRPARRPAARARDRLNRTRSSDMKVVLFCGGLGMRMRAGDRVRSPSR